MFFFSITLYLYNMKKQNLTEEIYRMRKLMNFDSKEYRDNTTSYDKLFEERLLTHRLIKEQQTEEPELFDWTDGGKYSWSNAKIKSLVKYVESVDTHFNAKYKDTDIYQQMLAWFESNDSKETRDSLKSWLFNDIYYGIPTPSEKVKKKKVKNAGEGNQFDRQLNEKLKTTFETAIKIANNLKINPIKGLKATKQDIVTVLGKLNTEFLEMSKNGILISKDEIMDILDILEPFIIVNDTTYTPINTEIDVTDYIDGETKQPYTDDIISIYNNIGEMYKNIKQKLKNSTSKAGLDVDIDSDDDVLVTVEPAEAIKFRKNVLTELVEVINKGKVQEKSITEISKMFRYVDKIDIFNDASDNVLGWKNKVKVDAIPRMVTGEIPVVQYPLNGDTDKSQNLFPDDGVTLSDGARTAIKAIMGEIKKMIDKQQTVVDGLIEKFPKLKDELELEILSIDFYAYSSTSKVRTRYGTNSKNYSEKNNIALSADRIKAMKLAATNAADRYIPDYVDDITDVLSQSNPNIGPGWNKLDGSYANGQPVPLDSSGYGKMFIDAYKRYEKSTGKKLTPRQFFSNRSTKAAVNASQLLGYKVSQEELSKEYESVYSPFRLATFGVGVTLRLPDVIVMRSEEEEFVVAVTPNLGIKVEVSESFDWKGWSKRTGRKLKKFFKKFKIKKRRKTGGKAIDWSKVCLTCCPKF